MNTQRPPLPPFTPETAIEKVRLAEMGGTARAEKAAIAYTVDSYWRNRAEFVQGREAIIGFTRKWHRELDYRLIKELWGFRRTGWPCGSPMSGTTTAAIGSAPTGMRTGNSMRTA